MVIQAHFDGRVIVPDEPVDLPVGQRLELEVRPTEVAAVPDRAGALAAAERLIARAVPGLRIEPDALRRERLYEDEE